MAIRDLITPTFLKSTTLEGVDFRDADGVAFSDSFFEQAIDAAIDNVEMELGIQIDPFTVKGERHDARLQHKDAFYPFSLDHRPLLTVDKLEITLGNYPAVEMPYTWATFTSPQHGQINLIPTSETIGSFFFRSGLPLLFGDVFAPYSYVPAYFSIDYTSGFTFKDGTATIPQNEKEVTVSVPHLHGVKPTVKVTVTDAQGGSGAAVRQIGTDSFVISVTTAPTTGDMTIDYQMNTVDPLLIQAILMKSAINPLDVAGDLIIGAGISDLHVSVDGLSQSIGTTASAMYGGYSARIQSFQKQYKTLMNTLRSKYRSPNILSV